MVGDLDLSFEFFPMPGEPNQSLLTYTVERGSPTQDALGLLASWAATGEDRQPAPAKDADHGVPHSRAE